jgi:hypothetical protein
MSSDSEPIEIAILDDCQGVVLEIADWSVLMPLRSQRFFASLT